MTGLLANDLLVEVNLSISLIIYSSILLLMSCLPLVDSYHWTIRLFDFPRAQLLFVEILSLVIILFAASPSKSRTAALCIILASVVIDLYRVGPYLPILPVESKSPEIESSGLTIKVLSYNVFIGNKKFQNLINLVKTESPDVVVLLETNTKWMQETRVLKEDYLYSKFLPRDNTYGIVLLSKYPMQNLEVKYLVDKNVPSIFADLKLFDQLIKVAILHPRPPRPKEGSSLQRDGELAEAATILKQYKNMPILVIGDFNDVAWSHSSRLFKRVAGLLDPRIGRGFYNTFHTSYPFLRFPLDHIFHNQFLKTKSLSVLSDIGSDHYPIQGVFSLENSKENQNKPETPSEDDNEEIRETKADAKKWTGMGSDEDSEESE